MPHAGLMNEVKLGPIEGPLQRARLHIRGGRRRLRQGKIAAGVATLYDATSAALEWYVADPQHREFLKGNGKQLLANDRTVYRLLVQKGVLDGRLDFDELDRILERALYKDLQGFDPATLLKDIESVMLQLGVMPFDESSLPPEDPATY